MKRRVWLYGLCGLLILALAAGCGGPEEKKLKFFNKGKELYEKGQYTEAKLEFKNAVQIDPKYADAYYMFGMVEMKSGNPRGAYGNFMKTVELDPKHMLAHLELGRLFLGARMLDKAQEQIDLVLKEEPKNEEALLVQSAIYLVNKDPGRARSLLEGLIAQGSTKPDIYLMLAIVSRQAGDDKGEGDAIRRGIQANPKSANLFMALADNHIRHKRLDEATEAVKKAIEIEPGNVRLRIVLANIYWENGKTAETSEVLKTITSSDPKKEEAWVEVAGFYLQRKKLDDAERELKAGIQQNEKSFKIRFALSELYANTGRVDQAVVLLKECLGLSKDAASPEVMQAKNALAKIALARQDIPEAKKYADEVIKESPKNTDALFIRGTVYLLRGEAANAIPDFRTVVTENPQFIPAQIRLAEAHALNGEPNLAMDTLKAAMRIDPKSRDLNRALARQYAMQRNLKEAEATLRKLLQANPNDLEVMVELGDLFMAAGNYKQAEAQYAEVKRKAPQLPVGYVKMAGVAIAQGKWDRAVPELEQALKANPQADPVMALLAQAYVRTKKPASAIALAEARIAKNPKDAFAYNLRGEIQLSQRDFAAAEGSFRKAIELQPVWQAPHNNLAGLFLVQGKKDEAIRELEAAIKANPDNLGAYLSIAAIYNQGKDYKKALETYERVLARKPDLWVANNDMAFLLADTGGDLDKAMGLAQKALAQRPEEGPVLDTLGWIYYKKGDAAKALEYLERARAKSPDDPTVSYHIGMAYAKAGKKEAAKEYLKKALAAGREFAGKEEAERTLKGM
jgi:tetratricopeptide (TPR) repeat protein